MAEKKKAWLYLRATTERSLKAQEALLRDCADEVGYEVTDVAADYTPSQSSLNLVRLAAESQDFEVLLVSSWNRLGEDLSEVIDTMTYLKDQNVAVQSAKERDMSLDQALSFAHVVAGMQFPDESLPEETDESPFEELEESEPLEMPQSL